MYNIYMYKIYVQKHQTDQKQFHWKSTYMQQENNLKKSQKFKLIQFPSLQLYTGSFWS